jgi:hypothetical protein
MGINTQQFSVKFDDQDDCEKKCIEANRIECLDCGAILTAQSSII